MKWFILLAGIWILIDEISIPVIQTCGWSLDNYKYIHASGGKYDKQLLHRIIAKLAGLDTTDEIDHIDGNIWNNQLFNLRPAIHSQNRQNSKIYSNNKSGYKGVSLHKGKYRATIKGKHLGSFDYAEQAHLYYCIAAIKYFGEFARFE